MRGLTYAIYVWEETGKRTKTKQTLEYIFHDEASWEFRLQRLFMLPAYYLSKVFKAWLESNWR